MEMLTDHEVEFLLKTAVECKLINKDDGLGEFYKALDSSIDDDQKAEIFRALANIAMGVEGPKLSGEFLIRAGKSAKSADIRTKVGIEVANYHTGLKQYSKATDAIDDAMKGAETKVLKAGVLGAKAALNYTRGDYEGAISLLDKAATIYKNKKANKEISEIHQAVGDAYFEMGNIESALASYREAYRFAQKTKGELSLSELSFKLGELNMLSNKITPAITYFEDCLKDKSDPLLTIRSLRNLALCYAIIGGDDEAGKLFEESISHSISLADDRETALSRDTYTKHLVSIGKYEEAKVLLDKNFQLRMELPSEQGEEPEGSWEFAQMVYKVYSTLMEKQVDEEAPAKSDEQNDKLILSGKIVAEVRRLIEMMHHVIDRPKNIASDYENLSLKEAIKVFKKEFLTERLALNNWDKNKVADELGVTLSNLYHHLETLGMNK